MPRSRHKVHCPSPVPMRSGRHQKDRGTHRSPHCPAVLDRPAGGADPDHVGIAGGDSASSSQRLSTPGAFAHSPIGPGRAVMPQPVGAERDSSACANRIQSPRPGDRGLARKQFQAARAHRTGKASRGGVKTQSRQDHVPYARRCQEDGREMTPSYPGNGAGKRR